MRAADAQIAASARTDGDARCDLEWEGATPAVRAELPPGISGLGTGAALRTAQIAGAIARVLDLSVRYAGERKQFGKPIGKFQAIQQQLAVLGELAAAGAMAAELALDAPGTALDPMRVACAKARISEGAAAAAAIGHAVHGAIGVTEEHDLQLYTRRLWAWRLDFGSESYWNAAIGRRLLGASGRSAWQDVIDASACGRSARRGASSGPRNRNREAQDLRNALPRTLHHPRPGFRRASASERLAQWIVTPRMVLP